MLSPTEHLLCAKLLGMASEIYSNFGCNDFDLTEFIPDEDERNMLVQAYCEWNGDPEEYRPASGDGDYRLMDYALMRYLADRITEDR
jgi:hypothetical protein